MTPGRITFDGSDPASASDDRDAPDDGTPATADPVGGEVIEHSESVRAWDHPYPSEDEDE